MHGSLLGRFSLWKSDNGLTLRIVKSLNQSGHLCDRMEVSVMHSHGNVFFWKKFQFSVSL